MGSKFFRISRQFIHFIELLVPPHKVQADLHGFPVSTLDANDSSIKPATRLAAARVDLRGHRPVSQLIFAFMVFESIIKPSTPSS